MKKLRQDLRSMLEIVQFSLRMSYQSSPRYFLLRLLLNMAYLVLPFALIRFSSQLVNLLVQSIGGQTPQSVFYPQFLSLTAAVLLIPLLTRTIENCKQYVEGLHQEILNMRARYLVMEKAASLDVGYFDSAAFYNEMNDANQNGPLVVQITFYILDMLRFLVQFVIAFAVLLQYDLLLSLLFAAVILPNVLFQDKQLQAIYSFQREHMAEERKNFYTSHVLTSRQYVKDVKMYNLFPFLSQKFQNCWNLLFTRKRKISRKYTLLLILFSFLPEIVSVLIFFRLGLDVYQGSRTMGDYTYYQGIVNQVLAAMWSFVSLFSRLNDGKLRIQNLMKFLKWENQVQNNGKRTLSAARFTVEFRGVSFRYGPELPLVLENVSFTLDSGRKTALVGNNGSGKSTIIKLLLRFYDPTEGEIRIDGTDIREFTL